MLSGSALHARIHRFGLAALREVVALNHKEVLVVCDDLTVDVCEARMAERQVVNGVEQVGLSLAVVADETIHVGRKR